MIDYHPTLQLATTASEAEEAFEQGKMAALIGMEGYVYRLFSTFQS